MDSRIGLDYIVENREYVTKLGTALDTSNVTVKKQVFELLSALCAYNAEGYARAVETLEHFKNLKETRYRFKIVVAELDAPKTPTEYQVALLAFVNCIIISTQCLQDRLRIRNEFIGLKILPVLNQIRRVSGGVADIAVQLDVFDEQRECDDAQSLQGPSGINLSSHLDVFYAILGQVADTPQEIPFLSILQHLLRIDPKEPISDIIWDTAETLVHRATLLENREDSTRLLRTPSIQKFTCPHCRGDISSPNRKQSLAPHTPTSHLIASPLASFVVDGAAPSLPKEPTAPSNIPAAPPPPPPMMSNNTVNAGPPAPPPPAPNLLTGRATAHVVRQEKIPSKNTATVKNTGDSAELLPQQQTPLPKAKMKTINWNKIPPNKLMGKHNIWTIVANSHQNSPMTDLDWGEMEGLFCQQATSNQGSPKMTRETGNYSSSGAVGEPANGQERKPRKENSEIVLLDGKRSLNINIFLKQFRTSNEEIIQLIKDGEHDDIGAEKLRGLLKILPEVDEVDMLKIFDGDKQRLGNAEKFLMQLSQVPNYKLRVESMLLKEEFAANLSYLEPSINAMVFAGDDLMNNTLLREVLYMVVVAGNFLNAGGYAGNAAGVKLSSLQKLTDIRANKPGMNLIHFVALQAEKRNRELLTFPENLTTLENASKTTAEQINNEINALEQRINKIKRQIELPTTEPDLKHQMTEFLHMAESKVEMLQRGMKEVEAVRLQLSEFFCEDPSSFKLEECFKIFQNFCDKFKQAVNENERRRLQEEQAIIRRKFREEQMAKRARQSQAGTPVSDSDTSILMDPSQFDMRASPAMARRRIGSFNSNGGDAAMRDDGFSPDITPTGSLRRRRSRALCDEDDNSLMDFLRSSGHDNGGRDRLFYGSLDRSWARRARSGSTSKKRPELQNIDFGVDRERPISPAPVAAETMNRAASEEVTRPRRISREWRQKIESWLQANEQDDKHNDDYKRRSRRLAGNRRSFENDSENERSKLDPLPEEKPATAITITSSSPSVEPYKRVYPDWKPSTTLEKTDVAANIEAIEESRARDKSAWRKSNLNVPNSFEEIEPQSGRLSRTNAATSVAAPLQSIVEEDRRKQQHGGEKSADEVKINVRRPSDIGEYEPVYQKQEKAHVGITSDQHSIYIRPPSSKSLNALQTLVSPTATTSQHHRHNAQRTPVTDSADVTYNKVEIDSDNIETPPAVRRNIGGDNKSAGITGSSLRKLTSNRAIDGGASEEKASSSSKPETFENLGEIDPLGDGQFDRYSLARRTRRYRRPTDHSSGNEERIDTTPDSSPSSSEPSACMSEIKSSIRDSAVDSSKKLTITVDAKEPPLTDTKHAHILSRVGKVGRNISSINQEAVREAIRNLKSPTETPERIWSPPREIVAKDKSNAMQVAPIKVAQHELNDEGFEETQSLVSDTPSHGKESTSSCNDQTDSKPDPKLIRLKSTDSTTSGLNGSEIASKRRIIPKSTVQTLLERNRQSLERSRSLRASNSAGAAIRNTIMPKRTNSLRKSDPNSIQHKRDVERSSSRTSLRSSRSSLNSSTSTNTVRNIALKTSAARTSPRQDLKSAYKKPFSTYNNSSTKGSSTPKQTVTSPSARTPASRSSSSGSSIGQSPRRSSTIKNNGLSTNPMPVYNNSFKENQTNVASSPSRPAFRSAVSNSSHSNSSLTSSTNRSQPSSRLSNLTKGIAAKTSSRVNNFMRPTTASATKMSATSAKGK